MGMAQASPIREDFLTSPQDTSFQRPMWGEPEQKKDEEPKAPAPSVSNYTQQPQGSQQQPSFVDQVTSIMAHPITQSLAGSLAGGFSQRRGGPGARVGAAFAGGLHGFNEAIQGQARRDYLNAQTAHQQTLEQQFNLTHELEKKKAMIDAAKTTGELAVKGVQSPESIASWQAQVGSTQDPLYQQALNLIPADSPTRPKLVNEMYIALKKSELDEQKLAEREQYHQQMMAMKQQLESERMFLMQRGQDLTSQARLAQVNAAMARVDATLAGITAQNERDKANRVARSVIEAQKLITDYRTSLTPFLTEADPKQRAALENQFADQVYRAFGLPNPTATTPAPTPKEAPAPAGTPAPAGAPKNPPAKSSQRPSLDDIFKGMPGG
jgi:hypothetical protein